MNNAGASGLIIDGWRDFVIKPTNSPSVS